MNYKSKIAFTLAEVLITLTIIGVVAALTIPTLIKTYEKRTIEIGLKKTYADLAEMIKRSEVDNGDFSTWDFNYNYGNSHIFVEKYFAPYLKLTQCKPHNGKEHNHYCFAGSDGVFYIWRYPNKEFGANSIGGNYRYCPKYILNDGRSIAFVVASGAHYKSVEIIVDVNGQIGESTMGKDVFSFLLVEMHDYNKPNLPLLTKGFFVGTDGYHGGSVIMSITSLYEYCGSTSQGGQHHCGEIIRRNNWKIPKDYPIKF